MNRDTRSLGKIASAITLHLYTNVIGIDLLDGGVRKGLSYEEQLAYTRHIVDIR